MWTGTSLCLLLRKGDKYSTLLSVTTDLFDCLLFVLFVTMLGPCLFDVARKKGCDWFHNTLVDTDSAINAMMWLNAGRCGMDQWNFVMSPENATQDPTGHVHTKMGPGARISSKWYASPTLESAPRNVGTFGYQAWRDISKQNCFEPVGREEEKHRQCAKNETGLPRVQ